MINTEKRFNRQQRWMGGAGMEKVKIKDKKN